jgi:hypothetical protein
MRALPLLPTLGLICTLLVPASAWAEAEWTDGSPPPLDFSLQVTAEPSTTAPYTWLRSTDDAALEQTWNVSGVDTGQLTGVTGGVADGMTEALGALAKPSR